MNTGNLSTTQYVPGAPTISALRRAISSRGHLARGNVMQRRHDPAGPRLGIFFKPDRAASANQRQLFNMPNSTALVRLARTVRSRAAMRISLTGAQYFLGPCGMQ